MVAARRASRFTAVTAALLLAACGSADNDAASAPIERGGRAGAGGAPRGGGGAAAGGRASAGASGKGGSVTAGGGGDKSGVGGASVTGGAAGRGGATPEAGTGGGAGSTATGGTPAGAAGSGGSPAGVAGSGGSPAGTAGSGGSAPGLPTGKGTLGYWCGPPAAFQSAATYDEIAAAGFTLTSNACDGTTYNPVYNKQMLGFAAARGLTSVVADQRVLNAVGQARDGKAAELAASLDGAVAEYQGQKALAGYHVFDEPSTALFLALGQVVSGLRARDPQRFSYLNLLPNYATAGQLGAPSYDAYVAEYLAKVSPQIVSWDYYPFLTAGDLGGFFENMAVVRAHSLAAKRPFWQFVQSISFNAHRATTEPEKRWVAMQSLAYGAQGIWYFTYWTPPQTAEAFGLGIIDPQGKKTAQYDDIVSINARFAALSRYLVPAISTGVFHNGPLEPGTAPRVPGSAVYLPSFAKVTVGTFEVPGHTYAVLANRDYTSATETDVVVPVGAAAAEILDPATGTFQPLAVTSTSDGSRTHLVLEAGDAVLLHLAGPVPAGPKGAEAMLGLVRADAGYLYVADSAFGVGALRPAGWDDCPTGYQTVGKDFQSNGFWLCARSDLAATTFYVGTVLADAGTLFEVKNGIAKALGPGGWNQCPSGTVLGRRFDSNGFWICH